MLRPAMIFFAGFAIVIAAGCGNSVPEIIPLSVTVKTAKGSPVDSVRVRFVPMLKHLDGNYISTGVTDDDGNCVLKLPGNEESSIAIGDYKVVLREAATSDAAREAYMKGNPMAEKKELRSRKNRPLPKSYERLSSTPLSYTIEVGQAPIDIVIK